MQTRLKFLYVLSSVIFSSTLLAEESAFPTVDCVINPSQIVEISAAVPGVVEKLYVDRSFSVEKGQLLATLKADVEKASVDLANARTHMKAGLTAEQVNLKYDRIQSNRINRLKEKELASTKNVDEAKRIKEVTYWRLKQAEENLKLRELELARSQAQLEEKRVYSTINGVVAERYKSEGEYVEDQPIFRLVQLNPLYIDAVFPMEYYSRFQPGMMAQIFPEVDQNQGYPVKVELIDSLGDAASGTFGVRLVLDNTDYQLPAGLKCFLQMDKELLTKTDSSQDVYPVTEPNNSLKVDVDSQTDIEDKVVNREPVKPAAVALSEKIPPLSESAPSAVVKSQHFENEKSAQIEPILTPVEQVHNKKLGPYKSKTQLDKIVDQLNENGVSYHVEKISERLPKGYLVVSSSDYLQSGSTLLRQFEQSGVIGMGRLPKNSYGGRISFGAYKGPVQANVRKDNLAKLGVRADVITRYKHVDQYWLDIEMIPRSLFEAFDLSK